MLSSMGRPRQHNDETRERLLRVASQDTNRKLVDVATEVADTGVLTIRRRAGAS